MLLTYDYKVQKANYKQENIQRKNYQKQRLH